MEIILDVKRINDNIFHFLKLFLQLPDDTEWMYNVNFANTEDGGMWDVGVDVCQSGKTQALVLVGGITASDGFNRMYFNTKTNTSRLTYYKDTPECIQQADQIRSHYPAQLECVLESIIIGCSTQEQLNKLYKMFKAYVQPALPKVNAFYTVQRMYPNSWQRAKERDENARQCTIEIRVGEMTGAVIAQIGFNIEERMYTRIVGTDNSQHHAQNVVVTLIREADDLQVINYNEYNHHLCTLPTCVDAFLNDNLDSSQRSILWSELKAGTTVRLLKDFLVINDIQGIQDLIYRNFTQEELANFIHVNHKEGTIFTVSPDDSMLYTQGTELGYDKELVVDCSIWEILDAS